MPNYYRAFLLCCIIHR